MNPVAVLRPVRFTDDVDAMRAFLELLGLASRIESERGGWVDMVAGSGMVALHDAATSATGGRPGQTSVSFEVEHADVFAARLRDAGVDATIYDEAYGRVLQLRLPDGAHVVVDERQSDLYGYRLLDARPDPGTTVVCGWSGDPTVLASLGLAETGRGTWTAPAAGEVEHGGVERLALRTAEPLDVVQERLTAAVTRSARTATS
jgi:hypothetical protein